MKSKDVDKYIDKFDGEKKAVLKKLRTIILKTFANIKEEMKMGVPWYKDKYYLVGLKDHVNIGFSINGLSKKEMDLFEGAGKLMRHIKIFSVEDIDEKKLVKLLKISNKSICLHSKKKGMK